MKSDSNSVIQNDSEAVIMEDSTAAPSSCLLTRTKERSEVVIVSSAYNSMYSC